MSKRLNFWYGSIFGTYWMIYGVVGSFASVFLLAVGFTNAQIGITLAAGNVLAVILQPLTAEIADRSRRIGVIGISTVMTGMMMVFALGMFLFGGGTALGITFILLIAWHTALQPMFNSLTFKLEETGLPVNFGVARSVGSLAYSILVAILGSMVEKLGIIVLPISAEVTCAMLLISLFFTWRTFAKAMDARRNSLGEETRETADERGEPEESERIDAPQEPVRLMDFVRRNRLFVVLNLGVVGLFFSNAVLNNYMIQIVEGVGGTSEDMGRILGLMAFLEIPTMVFFSRLRSRFSCQSLLKVASVGFTVKIAICWLARSVAMLFVAQFFQLVSFALFLPGMVYFTGENMTRSEAVRGQALFTTMITVTTIISSFAGGWILDLWGPKMLTFIATLATAAGASVVFAVVDRIGRED